MSRREILVTHALPYANGPLHIGHMLGYIQCDIWVRARRMAGDRVIFVSADDAHGTPIMLAAEKAGLAPEEFIKSIQISHERDFADFHIVYDNYYTTHSPENRELSSLIYTRLRDGGHIGVRTIRQLFDPVKQMFLPDRYIKGTCPNCGTPDQYGDNCENCGATYAPTDLIDPRSVVSGATPELRDSEHYFFKAEGFSAFLREWLSGDVAHPSVKAKLKEWLDADGGLRDWDISRDAPYFGFPIPDAPGKFFYVWLDAPVGYLASFKNFCTSERGAVNGLSATDFDEFMHGEASSLYGKHAVASDDSLTFQGGPSLSFSQSAGSPLVPAPVRITSGGKAEPAAAPSSPLVPAAPSQVREMHHFIGKDIVNFHGLFWPAMLHGANLRTPTALHVNGYLTVNGAKMSKSRGTFVMARTYLDAGLNADYLRYYFATVLGPTPTDVDLDLKAFEDIVNSHLVGKWVNLASRTAGFVHKFFGGKLIAVLPAEEAASYAEAVEKLSRCAALYEAGEFSAATRLLVEVADTANTYVAGNAPWNLAKDESQRGRLHVVCTLALNYFRLLSIYLAPIVPATAERALALFNEKPERFDAAAKPLLGIAINEFTPLATRVDSKKIETMIEASKESLAPAQTSAPPATNRSGNKEKNSSAFPSPESRAPNPEFVSIDDFAKLDLRIGKVLQCGFVDGSDKLLRFELDAGPLGTRQIFSGIRAAYTEPEKLVSRNVVFIANLAPRKMRFGISEGMILSAGTGGGDLFLLDADQGATPGAQVK